MIWNFENYKNNTALVSDTGVSMSYGELSSENDRLAEKIKERCLVFSLCSNVTGSVVGYTAFMRNNIVPVLLSANMDVDLLGELIDVYKPSYIWLPDTKKEEIFNKMKYVYGSCGYSLLKTGYDSGYPMYKELGLLLSTSGSTGSPKFVRQSYKNVSVNAGQIADYLELNHTERPVTTLPMNYTYGCSIINSHLLVGATILLTNRTMMDRGFWTYMKEQEATSFGGVPYTYEILEKLRFFRMELPALRYMTQAGGKLSPELHEKFAEYAFEKGRKFIVMYGSCEATARMGYLPAEKSLEKCGSCGIAIPGGKFYLVDDEEKVIEEPEKVGELVYEGENVTLGYAESGPDLIKEDERHGRLMTGDMAKRDAEGFYYIVGRKKRFLKIYGNRVNMDEIERMVKKQFHMQDCASSGEDDHMYIYITESKTDDVRKFVAEKTALNPAAFKVIKVSEIPKNESGKILYGRLDENRMTKGEQHWK